MLPVRKADDETRLARFTSPSGLHHHRRLRQLPRKLVGRTLSHFIFPLPCCRHHRHERIRHWRAEKHFRARCCGRRSRGYQCCCRKDSRHRPRSTTDAPAVILEIIAGREHLATAQRHPHIAGTNLTHKANNWYQLNINFSANTSRPF